MTFPVTISSEGQPISIQEQDDGPMFYVLVFFMVLVFLSGICWLFCCGTCVGRDTLKAFGFRSFLPSSDYNGRGRGSFIRGMRNYKYSPASTEEEWEMMLEEGVNENNVRVADDESVFDNDQEEYSALQ